MIILKNKHQIDIMDEANRIVHNILDILEDNISEGVKTIDLDKIAEENLKIMHAKPAFKGYMGYPSSICVSINEEIVHGIPSNRVIQNGDVISIDFGAEYKGFVGDSARTFIVGNVSDKVKKLVDDTLLALKNGIGSMTQGNRIFDISKSIEEVAKSNCYGNVKEYCGHGIGTSMHEDPKVLNYVPRNNYNVRLREGMVFALEPMFTLGNGKTRILDDGWTVVEDSGSISAHWEVSVAITENGPKILGKDIL
jgi:methionyl aminopeptidase